MIRVFVAGAIALFAVSLVAPAPVDAAPRSRAAEKEKDPPLGPILGPTTGARVGGSRADTRAPRARLAALAC